MSQPESTVLNGPNGELTMAFKDAQPQETTIKTPGGVQPGFYPRPPLQRVDSRASLQPRANFPPNTQGIPFRPPLRPQFPQQFQQRPPGPQNLQRPPIPPNLNQQPRPNPQNLGPPRTPILRPQQQQQQPQNRPPGIYQQKSFPAPREEHRTLESSGSLDTVEKIEDVANKTAPEAPAVIRPQSRSSSVASNDDHQEIPSRPESRASVQMKKIDEDDKTVPPNSLPLSNADNKQSASPSPQPDSVIEIKPKEKTDNKPIKIKTPEPARTPSPTKSPFKKEGDNDSGVDESTQGTESNNGDHSPRKSLRNNSRLTTPTKNRSFSRGSRSPNLKSPDSTPSTPGASEKKKLPMNKIQVGSAPSPNLKVVKSRIGSLANTSHKPGGGNIKIEHKKIDLSNAHSKIGAKNENYVPSGGEKKIISQKLQWNAKSKIGSLDNTSHKPKGGDKKIETVKLDFKNKAQPKVGSKDNMKHMPGGGDIKTKQGKSDGANGQVIENKKLNIKVESKVGSLENMKHKPGGGDKKIFDDKEYLRQKSGLSNDNLSVSGSQVEKIEEVVIPVVTQPKVRILEPVPEIVKLPEPRPPSSKSCRNSARKSRSISAPIAPWRY